MKSIYVCSRYAGDVRKNINNAILYSRWIYKQGNFPVCVHVFLNEVTGLSEDKGNRDELLKLGRHVLSLCDEVYVFNAYGISEGMKLEIDYAKYLEIPVIYIPFIKDINKLISSRPFDVKL